ncbi:sigma-70 family RNA polymerase sigma factor [Bacillus tuaregi]|uniref:sigma-70 family RNA polymerase sigma factor n=1 Tax=Bacillus tuaregi TaxID=1816695 RepID=UPI0008F80655|nr:sigma-70 family RNA polymerase sigma factor [Bacillus tuaregi]
MDLEFEQLASKYSNMIYSIIHTLHIYKNQDDFYQIGLIALWDASKNFKPEKGKFSTYAYSFIKGRILCALKKEKQYDDQCFYPSEEYWNLLTVETELLEKETLLSHFRHLTDREQKWVLQHFYVGLSNREIARIENRKLATVRSCERRALQKLRRDDAHAFI